MADETKAAQDTQTGGTTQSSQGQGSQQQSTQAATDGASSSKTATDGNTQTSQTQSQAPARPDGLPESFWDATTNKVKADSLNEVLARDAAAESRRLSLPAKVDEYKFETTKDFKLPQGMEFALDQNNPLIPRLKEWALKNAIPQAELSNLTDMFGAYEIARQQSFKAGHDAQIATLGATGPQRVDAIKTWADAKGYGALGKVLFTADAVTAMEKIMADMRSQGASGYTGNGRDNGANDGKIANYPNLSFEQKRLAQDQRRAR